MTDEGPIAFRAAGQDGFLPGPVAPPVCATRGGGAAMPTVLHEGRLRRMTPAECLALQGFPESHLSEVTADGRPLSDTTCYRLAGNSWCVPLAAWVLERIDRQVRGGGGPC